MTWEYLAGFFDGEGNILFYEANEPPRRYPRCALTQTKERGGELLKEIYDFLMESRIRPNALYKRINVVGNDDHRLIVTGRGNVWKMLTGMLPHLRIKKLEALEAITEIEQALEA